MDTIKQLIRRAARHILKGELASRDVVLKELQESHQALSWSNTAYSNECGKLRAKITEHRRRTRLAADWLQANQPTNIGVLCCVQFVEDAPMSFSDCKYTGGVYINPFDRWQVSPALR